MKKIIYSLLLVFLFSSCDNLQTVIEVDLPEHEPKLVVNSSNRVGEKWKAYVSVSQSPLSNADFVFLSDATVLLMDGDIVVDTMTYKESKYYYKSDAIVQQGTDFKIRVSHPMYESVSAGLYPFEKVEIKSVEDFQRVTNNNSSLSFTIDDPQSANYYMINIKGYFSADGIPDSSNEDEDYFEDYENIPFDSDDPSVSQGRYSREKVLFDDKLFNGTTKEINLLIADYILEKADSILLNFWSLDYAFYQYHTTRIIQSNTGNNPIFSSEPVNVYNSFLDENGAINGYGIFAVSVLDSVIIQTE